MSYNRDNLELNLLNKYVVDYVYLSFQIVYASCVLQGITKDRNR